MKSILVFAFVLAVVGGGIAYLGDRLGTYVGKKRISRFGLRPRHTATLYTTISGGLISVLTLLVLVGLDHTFQRALLEGPQLVYENSHYRQQIKDEKSNEQKERSQSQQVLSQLQDAKSQLFPVQQQLVSTHAMLQSSRQALLLRQQQLSDAQKQLQTARVSLGGTNQMLYLERDQVLQAKHSLRVAELSVTTARHQVMRQQQRLQSLQAENARQLAQNNTLRILGRRLVARAETTSSQDLIYHKGQEIGRLVVQSGQPVTRIEGQITAFLDDLGHWAEQQGGRHAPDRRAVVVAVPILDSHQKSIGDYHPLDLAGEKEAVKTLAQNIAGDADANASVVIVARVAYNTFQGEQTSVDLHPYGNVLIYPKDTLVATGIIDGTQSDLRIVDALGEFLVKNVRPAVTRQGLILQTDPLTGKPVVGSVLDEATSQALVQQIGKLGSQVQITALASEDTYSSGPLHLRFSVSSLAPASPAVSDPPGGRL